LYTRNERLTENAAKLQLPTGLAEMLKQEFPEVKAFVQMSSGNETFAWKNGGVQIKTIDAGQDFFRVFPFTFTKGNGGKALSGKNSIVLTESTAKKMFGDADPLNKVITNTYQQPFTVTGIIKNIPANTHFEAEAIVSLDYPWASAALNWKAYSGIYQYVLLADNSNPGLLQAKFSSVYEKYNFPKETALFLQPVKDIHLHSNFSGELSANSDIRYIYIFGLAAILLLVLASINYVNLSTARLLHRAREVGIRKILGAQRKKIIAQLLSEGLIFFFLATCASTILICIFSPLLAEELHIAPAVFTAFTIKTFLLFFGGILCFGIMSGSYPAYYLSGQSPAFTIKGRISKNAFNITLRKMLVVFQFAVSVFFIIATIIILKQLHYIQTKNLGFDKEQLVMIPYNQYGKDYEIFKNDLLQYPSVKSISVSSWKPGIQFGGSGSWDDKSDSAKVITVDMIFADVNFIKNLGIKVSSGRDFSDKYSLDTLNPYRGRQLSGDARKRAAVDKSIILNETAVKILGLQGPVVGARLDYPGLQGTVVGIVKDFNGLDLHHAVGPLALMADGDMTSGYAFIRLHPGNIATAIENIRKEWKMLFPQKTFEISFVDESLQKLYTSEKRLAALFSAFALLGIGIACLGIFGLVFYTVEQRTKEIGIRKVMGASVSSIVQLLSKDFLKLVVLSFVIATPVAAYFMHGWLNGFAYRSTMSWWMFALAGILAVCIALLTVSFQAIKAAVVNPVKALRSE
jgi:putative ABC transport system permease protein